MGCCVSISKYNDLKEELNNVRKIYMNEYGEMIKRNNELKIKNHNLEEKLETLNPLTESRIKLQIKDKDDGIYVFPIR